MKGPMPIANVLPRVLDILDTLRDSVPTSYSSAYPTGVCITTVDDRPEFVARLLKQAVYAGLIPSLSDVESLKVNGTRVVFNNLDY